MKTGYCCLYGKANAGKSTILNSILGLKIEATSPKPQTTRYNVQGIYNDEDSQIVFIDTPGLHSPHGLLGQILIQEAESAKIGVDVLIYVVDATVPLVNEKLALEVVKTKSPVVVAFNKIDLVPLADGLKRLNEYKRLLPNAEFVQMSALTHFGGQDLIKAVKKHLPEGEAFYPKDQLIDRPMQFVWSEMIREKCLNNLNQEVPHSIQVEITHTETSKVTKNFVIYADIIVEKASEKSIVIGKKGQMLSRIRHHAEHTIGNFMKQKVELELYVKVVSDWRDNPSKLKEYGYKE